MDNELDGSATFGRMRFPLEQRPGACEESDLPRQSKNGAMSGPNAKVESGGTGERSAMRTAAAPDPGRTTTIDRRQDPRSEYLA